MSQVGGRCTRALVSCAAVLAVTEWRGEVPNAEWRGGDDGRGKRVEWTKDRVSCMTMEMSWANDLQLSRMAPTTQVANPTFKTLGADGMVITDLPCVAAKSVYLPHCRTGKDEIEAYLDCVHIDTSNIDIAGPMPVK